MILGASFILTSNISTSSFCKLLLQEVHQTLDHGLDIQFLWLLHEWGLYGYLIFDCEISKQVKHEKIGML